MKENICTANYVFQFSSTFYFDEDNPKCIVQLYYPYCVHQSFEKGIFPFSCWMIEETKLSQVPQLGFSAMPKRPKGVWNYFIKMSTNLSRECVVTVESDSWV